MAIVKGLCLFPFIYNWILNYPHVFLDTNVGRIIILFTFFFCVKLLPFLPALFLLSLISLQLSCTIHPCFKDLIPSSVFSLLEAKIRTADPTGRISSLRRCIWNNQDFFIEPSSAVGLLVACYCRFYGLLSCFFLYLLSLGMDVVFRFAMQSCTTTSTQPSGHESSLGSVPTEEQEKVGCGEMTSNPIDGSSPSLKIEEVELEEKSLVTNIAPLNVDPSLDSIPLKEMEKDGFKEKPSNSIETSTSDGCSGEWFQMERDGMHNDEDTGEINRSSDGDTGGINKSPNEDRYRFQQLMKHLHPKLW
ncbi:hypothetical protein AAC387_Pa01g0230 [Persea americana]